MPLPTIPSNLTTMERWQSDMRVYELELLEAHRRTLEGADAKRVAALEAQAVAMRTSAEQMAALVAAAKAPEPSAGWTDADLARSFLASLIGTWGGGTTAAELAPIAASMVAAYRKLYPAAAA